MTDKPEDVRIATIQDVQALSWHCYELFKDNFMGLPFSTKRVGETVTACCTGQGGIAGVIDGSDGYPIASIGITPIQPIYSDKWILSESWMFVRPEFRGWRYDADLFAFAKWYRESVCPNFGYDIPLEMSIYSFKRLDAKTRLLKRHGMHVGSTIWVGSSKELPKQETN